MHSLKCIYYTGSFKLKHEINHTKEMKMYNASETGTLAISLWLFCKPHPSSVAIYHRLGRRNKRTVIKKFSQIQQVH